jgi:hypothetical protein
MYDGVYRSMVKAGVVVETSEERMYDKNGERVLDEFLMYGRPTKFEVIKPENIFFVDETGFNTNQKTDGHIGGKLLVLSSDSTDSGVRGSFTNIHFSVLCFNYAECDPILGSIILQSMKDISQSPSNVKLGIDRSMEKSSEGTR